MTAPTLTLAELLGQPDVLAAGKAVINACSKQDEIDRRAHALKFRAFAENRGDTYMFQLLYTLFSDSKNRALRTSFLELARHPGVIGRVLSETATIYTSAPRRTLGGNQTGFDSIVEEASADEVMNAVDRALVADLDVLLVPRVVDGELRIEVVPPDSFCAIARPADPTVLVAIAVEVPAPGKPDPNSPAWRVYTIGATYLLNGKGELAAPVEENQIDGWPVLLVTSKPPAVRGSLLEHRPGADLLSAEMAARFLAITGIKEAKSTTRQLAITGDASAIAQGQTSDTESELFLGEGVTATVLDRGVDLAQYTALAEKTVDDVLANHGIAPSLRRLVDAPSGAAAWQRRQPLIERRRRRLPLLRKTERKLWELVARILEVVGDPRAFAMTTFAIDYVEPTESLSEMEALAVFESKRRLYLDDTISEIMRRNPDLTTEQAADELRVIVERETARVGLTQKLASMNGGAASTVGSPTAVENGRIGAATSRPGTGVH